MIRRAAWQLALRVLVPIARWLAIALLFPTALAALLFFPLPRKAQ